MFLARMHLRSSEHEHAGTAPRGNSFYSLSPGSKTDFARDVESEERRGHWSNGKLAKRRAEATENLKSFTGGLYPVNPKRTSVLGLKAFPRNRRGTELQLI